MKAIIARSILFAIVTAMIPVSANAIEIKTPTVAVPHVNVPQVKTPQTTVHGKTLEMNTHITAGGNGGKTIEGQGNSRYQGTDKTVPLIGRGGEHPPSTATSSTPSGGQTTTVGLAHAATVGEAKTTTVGVVNATTVGGAQTTITGGVKSTTVVGERTPAVGLVSTTTVGGAQGAGGGSGAAPGPTGPIQSGPTSPQIGQALSTNETIGPNGLTFLPRGGSGASVANVDVGGFKRVSPLLSNVAKTVAPIDSNVPVPMANGPGSLGATVLQGEPNRPFVIGALYNGGGTILHTNPYADLFSPQPNTLVTPSNGGTQGNAPAANSFLRFQFGTVMVGPAKWGGTSAGADAGAGKLHILNPNGIVIRGDHQ